MTIIDSSINLYNYNLVYFIVNAGSIACLLCFIVTMVMTVWDVDNAAANVMPAFIGLLILCIAVIISVPFTYTNKNTTCYKVVLEPSFTEDEFNAITTGFVIDSYEDGFWYLEELNPNNEDQKPNTEEERHRFYLIYSGDEGEVEKLTSVPKAPNNTPSAPTDPNNMPSAPTDHHHTPFDKIDLQNR